MYSNIIGTQQIVIMAVFLGLMILALFILRRKSTLIRATLKAGKRVNVVEDTAISPTERLRLVTVDSNEFIMVSAKGHPPSLVWLNNPQTANVLGSSSQSRLPDENRSLEVSDTNDLQPFSSLRPQERSTPPSLQTKQVSISPEDEKQRAFAEKFKMWRQQNDAR